MKKKPFIIFAIFSLGVVLVVLFYFFTVKETIKNFERIFFSQKEEFPYNDTDFLIFENEDKNILFEFNVFNKESVGRLKVLTNGKEKKYSCDYSFRKKEIRVYYDIYLPQNSKFWEYSTFVLNVELEENNDYNSLLLSAKEENDEFAFFPKSSIKFNRAYESKINTIDLFFNVWQSTNDNFRFANYDETFFKRKLIEGTINDELVTLKFYDTDFEIKDSDDKIILKGKYSTNENNIILKKEKAFAEYPDEIILTYSRR